MVLSEEEYAVLTDAARRVGVTRSSYIAETTLACARDAVPPRPEPWREALVEVMAARTQASHIRAVIASALEMVADTGEVPDWGELLVLTRQAVRRLDDAASAIAGWLR
jgi:hypothetical protein